MKTTILDGYSANPGDLSWDGLRPFGELKVFERTSMTDEAEILAHIGDSDAIFTNKIPITEKTLAVCPKLKFIGVLATGYNIVDTEAAHRRGVVVSNTPAYSTMSAAQHTFALLLEICQHVGHLDEEIHGGRFSRIPDWCFWDDPLIELAGKTMGIIGLGSIGRSVAAIAHAFGMDVLAYSRTIRKECASLARYCSLEELLASSDVVSLHCPLIPETRGMIDQKAIRSMKDGAILLNCGRGPLLSERDVADALNSEKLYAAAMDVADTDPIAPDSPLLRAKNCILTPHIAWATLESRRRLVKIAEENLAAFCAGKPQNTV